MRTGRASELKKTRFSSLNQKEIPGNTCCAVEKRARGTRNADHEVSANNEPNDQHGVSKADRRENHGIGTQASRRRYCVIDHLIASGLRSCVYVALRPPQLANRTPTIFPRRRITSQMRRFVSPCTIASSKRLGTNDGISAITFATLTETSTIWHSWSARPAARSTLTSDEPVVLRVGHGCVAWGILRGHH
jgi:hypothetical protein